MPFHHDIDALKVLLLSLSALDQGARIPVSKLARRLKLGRDIIEYRIDRLMRQGVIRRFTATINPYKLGFQIYKIYLRLDAHGSKLNSMMRSLKSHSRLMWIGQCDGSWSLMIGLLARSAEEAYELERELLGEFNRLIVASTTSLLVKTRAYQRAFLLPRAAPSYFEIGGNLQQLDLDIYERGLIRLLAQHARSTLQSLAQALECSVDMIDTRIERLEKLGIITGYRVELDLARLGMVFVKAMLQLRQRTAEEESRLESFCARSGVVGYFIRQFGAYPIELELEVGSYDHFYKFIDDLREHFPGLIRNVDSIFLRNEEYRWLLEDRH